MDLIEDRILGDAQVSAADDAGKPHFAAFWALHAAGLVRTAMQRFVGGADTGSLLPGVRLPGCFQPLN